MDKIFDFGKNWINFSKNIDEERIELAINSFTSLIDIDFKKKSFFDVGCGSGLSSLVALRLGAKVFAIDSDAYSIISTTNLLKKFSRNKNYKIEQKSILDEEFIRKVKKFDVVYSWGVLHHTGEMWRALENCSLKVKKKGKLVLAIYNDQGGASKRWHYIKKIYVSSPKIIKFFLVGFFFLYFEIRSFLIKLLRFQNPFPFDDWKNKKKNRGMSVIHDLIDWVGGYPFEYSKPEKIFIFLKKKGFILDNLKTNAGGHGCNEYVFTKN